MIKFCYKHGAYKFYSVDELEAIEIDSNNVESTEHSVDNFKINFKEDLPKEDSVLKENKQDTRKMIVGYYSRESYGTIGEPAVLSKNLYVGDIVSFKDDDGDWVTGAITKDIKNNKYHVMGFFEEDLNELDELHKVIGYRHLSEKWLEDRHGLIITEENVKQMTLEQIENELGHLVKIID